MFAFSTSRTSLAKILAKKGRAVFEYSSDILIAVQELYFSEFKEALPQDFLDALNSEKGIIFTNPQHVYFFCPENNATVMMSVRRIRAFVHVDREKPESPKSLIGFEADSLVQPTAAQVLADLPNCEIQMI